jgi:carboxyl-terminal processing protease
MGKLDFAFAVHRRFLQRLDERIAYARARLAMPFDFTTDEEMVVDREGAPRAASVSELDELWRQRLKNQLLLFELGETPTEEVAEAPAVEPVVPEATVPAPATGAAAATPTTAAAPAAKEPAPVRILKRYEEFRDLMAKHDNMDVLELFLSTFTQVYDPHSTYFNERTSEDFDISMKLSLQGIGATLTMENGYTKVTNIIPGGPAAKDGRLKPGDLIMEVAQGDAAPENVVNLPLDKVVRKIRGEKGTRVTLTVARSAHDVPQLISLERDEVKLTEQEAKGTVVPYTMPTGQAYKLGIVYLPSFYADFEAQKRRDPNAKSTTSDVKRIVDDMVGQGIDGLVIDLRYNGGGALNEAIALAGLFIPSGPIVQVRERNDVQASADQDGGFAYTMPLAVMVNRTSASASEIFAAAIQDYGRGIVVGEEHTHGKGTVQTVRKLDMLRSLRASQPGALKYTMAKFYRVNGGSTQQRGVVPDFVLPSFLDFMVEGETHLKHTMAWDEIKAAPFTPATPSVRPYLATLTEHFEQRLSQDTEFQKLLADIKQYGARKEAKTISLNKAKRIQLRQEDEQWAKRSDEVLAKTKAGKLQISHELYKPTDDFYTRETFNLLGDLIGLLSGGAKVTAGAAADVPAAPAAAVGQQPGAVE